MTIFKTTINLKTSIDDQFEHSTKQVYVFKTLQQKKCEFAPNRVQFLGPVIMFWSE